jgi:hypothetical protein
LRRIFGPKRDEVIGEWRRLHEEELYRVIKKNEKGGSCSIYWCEERRVHGFGGEI